MKYARFYNPIVTFLLRLGLPIGPQALLTVPGRRTGIPRTTPVALNRNGVGWHLVSVYGQVDWVKNLQAAGSAVVTTRRKVLPVEARQLSLEEAAPVLQDLVTRANPIVNAVVGRHFEADANSPIAAWEQEAARHPVFLLNPARS